jgi:anaerobic dimethyl sulfoxide reductase subunit C (anchor subunit)
MSIEWALVFFTLLACLSVGVFAGVAVSEWKGHAQTVRKPGAVFALVALVASGLSSVLHLGHPERIFGALGHPTSGIFLEALMMGLFGLFVVLYILALRRKAADGVRKGLATVGMVPAVCLAFAVGYTYVMPSRPAWDTLILPLLYLASAAVMGCFAYAGLAARRGDGENPENPKGRSGGKAALAFLLIQAALTAGYVIYLTLAPHPDATRSAGRVLAGNLAPLFWIGIVIFGLLAPGWLAARAKSGAWLGLLCVLLGGVAFRVLMFAVGSSVRAFF